MFTRTKGLALRVVAWAPLALLGVALGCWAVRAAVLGEWVPALALGSGGGVAALVAASVWAQRRLGTRGRRNRPGSALDRGRSDG